MKIIHVEMSDDNMVTDITPENCNHTDIVLAAAALVDLARSKYGVTVDSIEACLVNMSKQGYKIEEH